MMHTDTLGPQLTHAIVTKKTGGGHGERTHLALHEDIRTPGNAKVDYNWAAKVVTCTVALHIL